MSSADTASTIELAFFLIEMAASIPLRMPVTLTVLGLGGRLDFIVHFFSPDR